MATNGMGLPQLTDTNSYSVSSPILTSDAAGDSSENSYMNVNSYCYDALSSRDEKQYYGWVDQNGTVHVSERSLPDGSWTTYDTGRSATVTDSHEYTAIGIDADGYLHMCWGMHSDPLNYAVSDNPHDPSSFTDSSMTGNNLSSVTYPQWMWEGDKFLYASREGDALDGDLTLKAYDVSTGSWSDRQNTWIDGEGDVVYADNFILQDGRLHATFIFRTTESAPLKHENYTYVFSDDHGSTWEQLDGSTVSTPIAQSNTTAFLDGGDVSNSQSLDIDGSGHPHVAYLATGSDGHINYHHSYYDGSTWTHNQVTNYTDTDTSFESYYERDIARPRILVDRASGAVHIFGRKGVGGTATVHKSLPPYDSYRSYDYFASPTGYTEFGAFDRGRWHAEHETDGMLSPADSSPSDIYVTESPLVEVKPIDVGSATAIIENFESGSLDSGYGGDTGGFSVQSSVASDGSYALSSSPSGINSISNTTLSNLPAPGDTFGCKFRYSATGDALRFGWAAQSATSEPDRYILRVEYQNGYIQFYKRVSGSATKIDEISYTASNYTGEWLDAEIQWGSSNEFTITVTDSADSEIGTIGPVTDNAFTASGGISFMSNDLGSGDSTAYWDYYRQI